MLKPENKLVFFPKRVIRDQIDGEIWICRRLIHPCSIKWEKARQILPGMYLVVE